MRRIISAPVHFRGIASLIILSVALTLSITIVIAQSLPTPISSFSSGTPIPWCPHPVSVIPFPTELTPNTGIADDLCEHFYVSSTYGEDESPLLARLNITLFPLVINKAPIPSTLRGEGYTRLHDFDWNGDILYVPVTGSRGSVIILYKSITLELIQIIQDPILDGVNVTTTVIDYGTRSLYAFLSGRTEVLVLSLASLQFQSPLTHIQWSDSIQPQQVRGAILQQPGSLYVMVSTEDANESWNGRRAYTTYQLDLSSGSFNQTPSLVIQPSGDESIDATGIANIWSADAAPNIGVYHAADSHFMYNFNICDSDAKSTMQHSRRQMGHRHRNCPASNTFARE